MMKQVLLCCIYSFFLLTGIANAQYFNIHTWESFESGSLPATMSLGYNADPQSVAVFPFGIPGTPKEMVTPTAEIECGRYGLTFVPTMEKKMLSLFSPVSLDRSRLGETGHALYQADFYLPPEGEDLPNIALLAAVANPDNSLSYQIYRFGILRGGKRVYFSYLQDPKVPPTVFESQDIKELNLSRPGWHRFQIIFKGQSEIYCAVDRTPTKFSPITETSLQVLNPGIMVAINDNPRPVVADNLSIQWSAAEVPLPDSPWVPRAIKKETNLLADGSPLPWFSNPSQAWTVSSAQKRPLLVMFYSPKMSPYQHLLSICPNDQQTNDLLQRHVLARVDANQLWGASLAQKLGVVRIPTLVVMGPDGREISRAEVIRGQTKWDELTGKLWPGQAGFGAVGGAGN
jgi:hypothetical protein